MEIDACNFSCPAELATAIRDALPAPGIGIPDDLWVRCGRARHKVTVMTRDSVCRGLLIASEMKPAE